MDFGAKVGFGAQLAYWRAQLALVTCGRTHAVTCVADSPNMWEQTGSFPPVRESNQTPEMSKQLHVRMLSMCCAVSGLCDAVRIRFKWDGAY